MLIALLSIAFHADPLATGCACGGGAATGSAWHLFALGTASVDDARKLDGSTVRSTFSVVNPPDYRPADGLMVVGDDTGNVSRSAVLPLDYLIDAGDTITVEGTLRVIRHPATVVGEVTVPAWTELRIADGRRVK